MSKNSFNLKLANSVSPQMSCEKCPVAWSELYLGGLALYNLISSYLERSREILELECQRVQLFKKTQAHHMSTAFFTIPVIFLG